MRTTTRLVVLASIMTLISSVVGCGPSGRDLSDSQWLDMQQSLQRERQEVGRQRDMLEADRRAWEDRERSEPVLAAAITTAALLCCCCLPLLLIPILAWTGHQESTSEVVAELLIDNMATPGDQPLLEHRHRGASTDRKRLPGKS